MRLLLAAALYAVTGAALALPAAAQTAAAPATAKLYAAPQEYDAAVAAGRAAATMTPQMLVANGPYRAQVEHRDKPTPASLHEATDEFISVTGGSGTIVIGGTLKDQTRRNPTNLSGSGIEGGTPYTVAKGSYFLIPAGTPHYFASMGPEGLTIVALHVPKQ
ncbi:MAG: hypothetical protein BGN82_01745 [Alphaproteobacteria bacterium 65-7]|nr:MAG: hypothetical protein BGN82_01745 [Alphaproteobacteria bacterium 65-7]